MCRCVYDGVVRIYCFVFIVIKWRTLTLDGFFKNVVIIELKIHNSAARFLVEGKLLL